MKVLVDFTNFTVDNYQGGSGQYLKHEKLYTIPSVIKVGEVEEFVINCVKNDLKKIRPYQQQDCRFSINSIKLFL